MLTKSFVEMMQLDISEYTATRDGIEYLPWANCKVLLHQQGAEKVFFEPLVDPVTNSSVFMTNKEFKDKTGNINRCYEVAVKITIDDDVFVMRTPIMNGANPVKDNSLSQQRVWAAQCRAFVKGVAMRTGLGFQLWVKGDIESEYTEDLSRHNIFKIKERLQEEYSTLMYRGLSLEQIADKLGMTTDEVKLYFTYFDLIDRFEQKLVDAARAA